MDATKPYKFIGFGAMDATKPYEFIGFGAMDAQECASLNAAASDLRSELEDRALRLASVQEDVTLAREERWRWQNL